MSSSEEINALIPLFNGAEYCTWKEQMTDFLGSQCMMGYVTGARPCPVEAAPGQPMVAEQAAQVEWDKNNLQVKSLIGLRVSPNLCTHMGTTAQDT